MKISEIEIQDYNQFKNFKLDLTYPKGHTKEGQPLDKICIIGQSGTGKTTLLNVIEDFTELAYDKIETTFLTNARSSISEKIKVRFYGKSPKLEYVYSND